MDSSQIAKKTKYNLLCGVLSQLISIVLGVLLPKLFLVNYGSEVNGLISSVTQIYAYISLVESGIGTAALQALYRTISIKNNKQTNAILSGVNYYYKRIGLVYLVFIALFAAIYPMLVDTDVPSATIVLIIVFIGLGNNINFFCQGKYKLLLQADGKNYVTVSTNTCVHIAVNISKILLICLGCDVVSIHIASFFINLSQTAYIYIHIKKHYNWINLSEEPDFQSIKQSRNVLVHQLSGLVFNNTDTIILTFACGLATVSVYSLYTLLFGMISTFLNTITESISFILGQSYHANKKIYLKLLSIYELFYMSLVFALYSIANIFIIPFVTLYTTGITDADYTSPLLPFFFIATYLLSCGRKTSNLTINFAEHFNLTQNRSILEAVINITVSIICVFRFGIYGVLIGTIAALLYRTNDMIIYANKKILHRSPWKTYRRWLVNLGMFIIVTVISKYIFAHIALDTYPRIILWAAISCVIIIPLFFVVASIFDKETFLAAKEMLSPYFKKLLSKLHKAH